MLPQIEKYEASEQDTMLWKMSAVKESEVALPKQIQGQAYPQHHVKRQIWANNAFAFTSCERGQ